MKAALSLLLPCAAAAATGHKPAASTNVIDISLPHKVTRNASQPVDHGFASFSFPAHFFAEFTGNKSHPNLFSRDIFDLLHKKTGAHPYIRIGGTSTDRVVFNASQEEAVILSTELDNGIPSAVYIGPSWFEGFHNFPGSLWNFQANLASQAPGALDNTLEVCRRVMHELKSNLIAFEIGNEPDLYFRNVRPSNYTVKDYVKEWKIYAEAISRQVLMGNPYGLPERTFFQGLVYAARNLGTFTTQNAFEAGIDDTGLLKSVSLHLYAAGNQPTITLQNSFMNHVGIAGNLTQFKTDMAVIKQYNPKITFLLGETNSDYVNLNMAQYEGVFGSALWLVDYLLFGMTVNIARYNLIQGTTFGYTGWVPAVHGEFKPSVRPPLYGQLVVADIIGRGPQVQVQAVDLGLRNFSAYGVYERGKLSKYVLINLDEWNSTTTYSRPVQTVTLDAPAGAKKAVVQRLTGPGASADTGIKWGGLQWNCTNGRLVQTGKEESEKIKAEKGQFTLEIESSQGVVVTVQ